MVILSLGSTIAFNRLAKLVTSLGNRDYAYFKPSAIRSETGLDMYLGLDWDLEKII